ncbi:Hypothetical predicted protein [Cloeon dipterum]|uniref:Uncharacterized protein n=1 Tax=Cloeon dipterum TaxID=197152 RepID=A0A8S1DUW2_9INSE|nr:Hypothetical predicted protein [Cloeon dipterum]
MAWIKYHQEFVAKFEEKDGVIICHNLSNLPIFVARTLRDNHYVPVNGVGYFVSPDVEQFQTSNFQVLVDAQVELSKSHERGIVADDEDKIMRFSIGSFCIEKKRLCGLVLDNKICCINFDNQVYFKNAPKFKFIVKKTTNHPPEKVNEILQQIDELNVKKTTLKQFRNGTRYFSRGFNEEKALSIGHTKDELPIYLARTRFGGHCIPGYALDGMGYFVSVDDLLPFQTRRFDVVCGGNMEFFSYDAVPEHRRVSTGKYSNNPIYFGSFKVAQDLVLCGMARKMPWHNPAHGAYEGSEALVVCPDTFEGNPIPVVRTCIEDELLFGYALGAMGYFTFEYWEDMPPCFRANRNFEMLYEDNLSFVHPEHVGPNQNYYNLVEDAGTAMYLGCFPVNGIQLCGELRDGNCSVANYANLTVETNIADYTSLKASSSWCRCLLLQHIFCYNIRGMAPIPNITNNVQRNEDEDLQLEPNWISYDVFSEYIGDNDQSALFLTYTRDELPIYVARTTHDGHCIPGYGIDGVGFFVSLDQQIPFQTDGFDVIFTGNYEFAYPYAVPASRRVVIERYNEKPIHIGSFYVERDLELCGMVINDVCYINYNQNVVHRYDGFKVLKNLDNVFLDL